MTKAFISGCSGTVLASEEIAFFRAEDPWGLILFARNVEMPDQVRALTGAFRDAVGRFDAPVLIDQEGGRVQRLRPPHWPAYPPHAVYGRLYTQDPDSAREAARLGARLIAHDLSRLGINVDCLPCLDVAYPETADVIGDRALAADPDIVAELGRCIADGLADEGVRPVIKHIPGHGRSRVDSHLELPRVESDRATLSASDFVPFKALADLPMAMTAHILYTDLDPARPATQSRRVIDDVIRKEIGFAGCLMSDDLSMSALDGEMSERAANSFAAGCDIVLHCNGDMTEMRAVANVAPRIAGESAARCARALDATSDVDGAFDAAEARHRFDRLIAPALNR